MLTDAFIEVVAVATEAVDTAGGVETTGADEDDCATAAAKFP